MFGTNVETIESLAEDIADASKVCGQLFVDNLAKDDNGNATSTNDSYAFAINEYLYFFLHYVNRSAFALGGVAAQKKICTDISLHAVAKLTASLPEQSRADAFSMLLDGLNDAELEYSKCARLSPEDGASPKGTLFWEASKRISTSAGGGMDITNIVVATQVMTFGLSSLKLEDRIEILAGVR